MTPSGPEKKVQGGNFFVYPFKKSCVNLRIFKDLDWPSSVCDWHVMDKNHKLINQSPKDFLAPKRTVVSKYSTCKGAPRATVMCKHLAFKGAPNSNYNVKLHAFKGDPKSNCNV